MNPNITKIIDKYLSGELSPQDRAAFEERMAQNHELATEVQLQREITEAANRSYLRNEVLAVRKSYHLTKLLKWGGSILGVGIITAIVLTQLLNSAQTEEASKDKKVEIKIETIQKMEKDAAFNQLDVQHFQIGAEGNYLVTDDGIFVSVPANAFQLQGKPYKGACVIQLQEAIEADDIILAGLSTMSGDKILETQGMIDIKAYTPDGKRLEVNPEVGIYVQIPVDENRNDMQLFEGKILENGQIDWQNPTALYKNPIPVDMNSLNFYPPGFDQKLDALKWKQSKKERDSLYLSFENHTDQALPAAKDEIAVVQLPYVEASYPGGFKAMQDYIISNTNYPQSAMDQGISGKVHVSFIVDIDGGILNAVVEKSVHPLLDAEALRLIKNMPNWTPARDGLNRAIVTRSYVPIDFAIEGNFSSAQIGTIGNNQENTMNNVESDTISIPIPPNAESSSSGGIPPSSVLAFWKPNFNNTNLATHEFEQRMQMIHGTCNKNVLKKYTSQLNKNISDIDAEVVAMGYPQFQQFANERIGKVNANDAHQKNLKAFYEESCNKLQKLAEKNRIEDVERQLTEDRKYYAAQTNSNTAQINNRQAALREEIEVNSKKTFREVGKDFNVKSSFPQLGRTAGFTIRSNVSSWNVDAFTAYSTANRKSGTYVAANGKKTSLTYKEWSAKLKQTDFDLSYCYILPKQLQSYIRLNPVDGTYSYILNMDFNYSAVFVGVKDGRYFYAEQHKLKPKLQGIEFQEISASDLSAKLIALDSQRKGARASFRSELEWITLKAKRYQVEKLRMQDVTFRSALYPIVYPCGENGEENNKYKINYHDGQSYEIGL